MNYAAETALVHSMGQNGFKFLTTAGTSTYAAKKICAVQAITDCTLTVVAVTGFGDSITAQAISAGTTIVGLFSSVTVAGTGGVLLAYLAERE